MALILLMGHLKSKPLALCSHQTYPTLPPFLKKEILSVNYRLAYKMGQRQGFRGTLDQCYQRLQVSRRLLQPSDGQLAHLKQLWRLLVAGREDGHVLSPPDGYGQFKG